MKIAYIVSRYPAVSHTFILREVLGLRVAGFDVTTISVRRADPAHLLTAHDQQEYAGTHILVGASVLSYLGACLHALTRPLRLARMCARAWSLRRPGLKGALWACFYALEAILAWHICHQRGINHYHAHFANVACDVALLAALLAGPDASFTFTMHGPTEFADVAHFRLAEKAAAAASIICISDFARSQLMALLPPSHWSKLRIVHCGIDLDAFRFKQRTPATVSEILCVGRLVPVKAQALLLEALATLNVPFHLTLVGDGPDRARLESLTDQLGLRPHITFAGNIGQNAIHTYYQRAHLFVLPSFAEGLPVVLIEAMASGVPVISTRIAGIPELIEHNVEGLLVRPGRVDCLRNAIQQLLSDKTRAHAFAHAARAKVESAFDGRQCAQNLAAIFHAMQTQPAQPIETPAEAVATGAT